MADRLQFVQSFLARGREAEYPEIRGWIASDVASSCIEVCRNKNVSSTQEFRGLGRGVAWIDRYQVGEHDATAFMSIICLFHGFAYVKEK